MDLVLISSMAVSAVSCVLVVVPKFRLPLAAELGLGCIAIGAAASASNLISGQTESPKAAAVAAFGVCVTVISVVKARGRHSHRLIDRPGSFGDANAQ